MPRVGIQIAGLVADHFADRDTEHPGQPGIDEGYLAIALPGDAETGRARLDNAFQELFIAYLFGNIGIGGDKATTGHGAAVDLDDIAIGSCAMKTVRGKLVRQRYPFPDLGLDVARAIFAPFGVVAKQGFQIGSFPNQSLGEVEQFGEAVIEKDQLEVAVEYTDSLDQMPKGVACQIYQIAHIILLIINGSEGHAPAP